jgi:hypothetical protein
MDFSDILYVQSFAIELPGKAQLTTVFQSHCQPGNRSLHDTRRNWPVLPDNWSVSGTTHVLDGGSH